MPAAFRMPGRCSVASRVKLLPIKSTRIVSCPTGSAGFSSFFPSSSFSSLPGFDGVSVFPPPEG